jgi:hypothetical protein
VEEVLLLGDTSSDGINCSALVLPSEGGHTHALLSSGSLSASSGKGRNECTVRSSDSDGRW